MKDCLTLSSVGWKLMRSLGQDEPIYTYSHPYTRLYLRQDCYGGRAGANILEFESTAIRQFLNVIRSHLLGLVQTRECKTPKFQYRRYL